MVENFILAARGIAANKMRSFLTVLGIIFGTAAVIAVVSLVQGLNHVIVKELEGIGTTYILVVPENPYRRPELEGREIKLTLEDGLALLEQVPGLEKFDPVMVRTALVQAGSRKARPAILGVGADHQEVSNHWVDRGRFLMPLDIRRHAKVCVVGTEVVRELGLGANPVGKQISLKGTSLTVVGVMEEQGELLGQNRDEVVLIPITTARDLFGSLAAEKLRLEYQAASAELVHFIKDRMEDVLLKRHGIKDFRVLLQEELLKRTGTFMRSATYVVGGVVSVALLVGGIGIMNIMLVSVAERTKEIGIRKAVGAKRRDLMLQFLVEASVLSLFGGVVGIGVGWVLGAVAAAAIPGFPPAHVPAWAVLLGFGASALVGVLFGTYPAAKAASLDPIEALRYE